VQDKTLFCAEFKGLDDTDSQGRRGFGACCIRELVHRGHRNKTESVVTELMEGTASKSILPRITRSCASDLPSNSISTHALDCFLLEPTAMTDTRSFLQADILDLVRRLTTNEKISLLGAPNWWNTTPIPRLNIPSIRMSDGPNVCYFPPQISSVTELSRASEDPRISSPLQPNAYL
jgi:hypothetical protein